LFDATSYSYILYGMKYNTRAVLLSREQAQESAEQLGMVKQRSDQLVAEMPGHREWLTKLNAAMKQMRR
jgi:hypothetical protein